MAIKRKRNAYSNSQKNCPNTTFTGLKRSQSSFGFKKTTVQSQIRQKLSQNTIVNNKCQVKGNMTSVSSRRDRTTRRNQVRESSQISTSFVKSDHSTYAFKKAENKLQPKTPQTGKTMKSSRMFSSIKYKPAERKKFQQKKTVPVSTSLANELSEIKIQSTRTAKQLTAKTLTDFANHVVSFEVRELFTAFVIVMNSFKRSDIRLSLSFFKTYENVQSYIRNNSRSILPELLSLSAKAQRGNFCNDGLTHSMNIFNSSV